MSETHKSFTPEQRIAFEEKYNLGVYNHEAMVEILMQQDKRIQQLEERLMEVGERITTGNCEKLEYLADKWK